MLTGMVMYRPRPPRPSVPVWLVVLALIVFFPLGIVLMWTGGVWSLRTRRAVTGALLYPFGLWVLWRHTRLPQIVKLGATAAAAVATAGLALLPDNFLTGLVLALAVGFLMLYLGEDFIGPGGLAGLRTRLGGRAAHEGVAGVEEARTAPERRLLLAQEIMRVAEAALAIPARERDGWPAPARMAALRAGAAAVLTAARDRATGHLPEPRPDDPLTHEALLEAAADLARYTALLHDQQISGVRGPEALRILLRERTRLQLSTDRLVDLLRTA